MPQDDKLMINTQIEISGHTLQQIVSMAKRLQGPDAKGHYSIDTADLVSDLISRFLIDGGFDAYVAEKRNYENLL
jgi:hypothetical protein